MWKVLWRKEAKAKINMRLKVGRPAVWNEQVNLSLSPSFPLCTVEIGPDVHQFLAAVQAFDYWNSWEFPLCLRRMGYLCGSLVGLCPPFNCWLLSILSESRHLFIGKLKCDDLYNKMHNVYIRPFIKLNNICKMYYSYHQSFRTHIHCTYSFTHITHVILMVYPLMEVDK